MMKDLTIGIVGLGMIGNSTAVLTTLHGYKTICYVRNEAKIPTYKAGFDKMYDELIAQGIITEADGYEVRLRILELWGELMNRINR